LVISAFTTPSPQDPAGGRPVRLLLLGTFLSVEEEMNLKTALIEGWVVTRTATEIHLTYYPVLTSANS